MFKNYIKIAFRNIIKHKAYSFINIIGLAIGLACSILIYTFVFHEMSYDKFHKKADRIYRVAVRAMIGDTRINQTNSSAITYLKFLEDFPEIETGVKFCNIDEVMITKGERKFSVNRLIAVDSTFFKVFSFSLLSGHSDKVLNRPNTMVISESTANKYFQNDNPVGLI